MSDNTEEMKKLKYFFTFHRNTASALQQHTLYETNNGDYDSTHPYGHGQYFFRHRQDVRRGIRRRIQQRRQRRMFNPQARNLGQRGNTPRSSIPRNLELFSGGKGIGRGNEAKKKPEIAHGLPDGGKRRHPASILRAGEEAL